MAETAASSQTVVGIDLSRFDNRRRVREALAAEPVAVPSTLARPSTATKTKSKTKTKSAVSFFAIVSYLAIFALMLVTVMYYMRLNELSVETSRLQTELSSLENDAAKLQIAYERGTNLREIDTRAAELGLYTPAADQIVYIDITRPDRAVVYGEGEKKGFVEGVQAIFLAIADFFE